MTTATIDPIRTLDMIHLQKAKLSPRDALGWLG
jgi:hypothetical protein